MTNTPAESLLKAYPEVAIELHPKKNSGLDPKNIASQSHKKVWWKCRENPKHEWLATIQSRTARGAGCPFCAGRYVCKENSLDKCYPEVAAEWHPTKNRRLYANLQGWEVYKNAQIPAYERPENNRRLKPSDLSYGSKQSVWWRCKANPEHVWEAAVFSRTTGGQGCPYCSHNAVSQDNCLLTTHPQMAKQWHHSRNRLLTPEDVTAASNKTVWWRCFKSADHVWEAKISNVLRSRDAEKSGCPFCAGVKVCADNSLKKQHPEVAALWHPKMNLPLTPSDVTPGSNKAVFWQCPKSVEHVWKANIFNLVAVISKGKSGCPFCAGKKVSADNSFQGKYPQFMKYWHTEYNRPLCPDEITGGSGRSVWWRCLNDKSHAFEARICAMVTTLKRGSIPKCPECYKENSLRQMLPELAKHFCNKRNLPLTANDVHAGSHEKIWWKCLDVKDHKWQQVVRLRVASWKKGIKCPFC